MTKLHLHAMTEYEHNIEKQHLNLQKKEDAFHNQKKGKILLVDDEPNTCMGFQIVLKYCLGHEFDEDKKDFKQKYGRSASQDEEPYILTPLMSYDKDRKGRFIDCIKKKTKTLMEMDDNARIKISLQLWSGCMMTPKVISAGTQTGPNTPDSRKEKFQNIINPYANMYSIFKVGEKVAPFYKLKVREEVSFDGIPAGSAVLEVKNEFNNIKSKKDSTNSQ
jgi:hypothetical protein